MRLERKYIMFSPFGISSNVLNTLLYIQLYLIVNTNTLVGPIVTRPVQDPQLYENLNNRLCIPL